MKVHKKSETQTVELQLAITEKSSKAKKPSKLYTENLIARERGRETHSKLEQTATLLWGAYGHTDHRLPNLELDSETPLLKVSTRTVASLPSPSLPLSTKVGNYPTLPATVALY